MSMKEASSFHYLLLLLSITCSYFQYYYSEGCLEEERRTLLLIKDSISPINEGELLNWVGKDCCKWVGIKCGDSSSHVVYLRLYAVRNATFDEMNYDRIELQQMYVNGTKLLQAVCQLNLIEHLNIAFNSLEGVVPPCFGHLTSLKFLDLSHNKFHGNISSMSHLNALVKLYMSHNHFQGNLPSLSHLNALETLDMSHNQFQGNIPSLSHLNALVTLDMSYNQFQGSIPSLSCLNGLETLDLSHNQFRGNILHIFGETRPIRMRDASNFSNATTSPPWKELQILNLNFNELTGDGWDLAQVVCQLSLLEVLGINSNSLEGIVPPCLGNLTSLEYLSLAGNKFTGNIPAMDKMNALQYLNLSDNGFEGDILNLFGQNHFVRDMSSPYGNMSSPLLDLDLSNNALTGDGWYHFQAICQLKSLNTLFLDHNSLEGRLHPCLGMMHSFFYLDLSYNRFQGNVPPISDGLNINKTFLAYLDLSNNRLEGDILAKGSNMSELTILKLHDNSFTRLITLPRHLIFVDLRHNHLSGDIYSASLPLPDLRALLFGGNHLEGKIPKQLCEMELLKFIDLSDNNLSGKIPSCLNNISSMGDKYLYEGPYEIDVYRSLVYITYSFPAVIVADFTTKGNSYTYIGAPLTFMTGIDLSCNQLTGGIPSEIGDLWNLHALNLSNNRLAGSLPTSFQNLENIESLDLSCNEISGVLPQQLTQLTKLSVFNVSFNNLSGSIPISQQFSTFKYDCFVGNVGLCGPQVKIKCSNNTTLGHNPPQPNLDDEDEATSLIENRLFFYSWVAISYAIGFWVVIGLLVFNKKQREKYFRTIDEYIYMS